MRWILVLARWTTILAVGLSAVWAGANTWTSIGPDGGRVSALVIDPRDPNTLYVTTNGGVSRSTDGGKSWNAANSGLSISAVNHIAIDQNDPATLFVTTGNGIFKSRDAAASWKPVSSGVPAFAGQNSVFATALAIDPHDSNTVYVALCCNVGGVFKSSDGGTSWSPSGAGLLGYINVLVPDPKNPGTVYAGSTDIKGIFKTTDGGNNWTALGTRAQCCIATLLIDPQDSNTLYAGVCCTNAATGISKSTNGGATWSPMTSGLPADQNFPFVSINVLAFDPLDSSTLYAGTSRGLFRSTNGASTWSSVDAAPHVSISVLAVDPRNFGTLFAGTGNGVVKSTDRAATWSAASSGLKAPVQSVYPDPGNPRTIYAVTQLSVSRSMDGGETWIAVNEGLPGNFINSLAIDTQNSSTVYAGVSGGGVLTGGVFKSNDSGANWNRSKVPRGGGVEGLSTDPQDPNTLYAWNSMGTYKTSDGAATWNTIRPADFTAQFCFCMSAVVVDRHDTKSMYGITPFGVLKSRDGGASWLTASSGLPVERGVRSLAIDPQDGDTLYAWDGIYNATGPRLFKTSDGGASWNLATEGLQGNSITALVIPPQRTNILYAATSGFDATGLRVSAVFTSADGGAHWNILSPTLPAGVIISSLAIDATHLYAATLEGAFAITVTPIL